jgi:hypothetical protein
LFLLCRMAHRTLLRIEYAPKRQATPESVPVRFCWRGSISCLNVQCPANWLDSITISNVGKMVADEVLRHWRAEWACCLNRSNCICCQFVTRVTYCGQFCRCSDRGYLGKRSSFNVRFGSKADICSAIGHVRFTPKSGHWFHVSGCPLCAKSGLMHCSKISTVLSQMLTDFRQ